MVQQRMEEYLLDAIVDRLGNLDARAEVLRVIENSFSFYRGFDELFARASMTKLAEEAKEIAGLIAGLENKLQVSANLLIDYLLTPVGARITATSVPDPRQRADDLLAQRTAYKNAVLGPLRQMRLDCESLLAEAGGRRQSGPEFDRGQRFCARLAHGLMTSFSTRPITGSVDGPDHRIASVLYEALTGREEVDLKRHCDAVRTASPLVVRLPS
jgi:hypothetical protein